MLIDNSLDKLDSHWQCGITIPFISYQQSFQSNPSDFYRLLELQLFAGGPGVEWGLDFGGHIWHCSWAAPGFVFGDHFWQCLGDPLPIESIVSKQRLPDACNQERFCFCLLTLFRKYPQIYYVVHHKFVI